MRVTSGSVGGFAHGKAKCGRPWRYALAECLHRSKHLHCSTNLRRNESWSLVASSARTCTGSNSSRQPPFQTKPRPRQQHIAALTPVNVGIAASPHFLVPPLLRTVPRQPTETRGYLGRRPDPFPQAPRCSVQFRRALLFASIAFVSASTTRS